MAAFGAGFLTFFTPCVLPLIPAWLTVISGLSFERLAEAGNWRWALARLLPPTALFVLGFGLIFTLLGLAAGWVGDWLSAQARFLRLVTGSFLIFFGLYLLGIIRPGWLMREKRLQLLSRPLGLAGSFVVGLGFAAGWTPCVGPVLASILALAASESSAAEGARLLAVFSLGLGLPFLGLSLLWGPALSFLARARSLAKWANPILGLLLIALGLAHLSGRFNI